MKKFRTEQRPFTVLRPGDLVGMSYGFVTVKAVVWETDGRVTIHSTAQDPVTFHASNWPDVAVGFTTEYQKAYPDERFEEIK